MRRLVLSLLLLTAVAGGVVLLTRLGAEASPATFTVDSIGDGGDSNTGDGVCDDGSGNCTLRAAIEQANADAGTDTIEFDIAGAGPHTISPGSALPTITDPVIIDGTSEPDFSGTPIIELDGSGAGAGVDGLKITAGSSIVKGLVINGFGGDGIELFGSGGNTIEGNYIGTDVNGTADLGNSKPGVLINGAPSNTVGGTTEAARNIISGNDQYGVCIYGSGATGNLVQGNYIGTDVTGTADLGNSGTGVYIEAALSNTIGGTAAGAGNVISGNDSFGVYIYGSNATGNVVEGNYIGTDVTGTADLGNAGDGVYIVNASSNTIGGTAAGARNVISGNDQYGVGISGSTGTGNVVEGNYIGTDVNGTADLGNSYIGVVISGAPTNTIGGTTAGAGNVISGNNSYGIVISASSATGNVVEGNYIGTDSNGTADLGNSYDGVRITDAPGNTIGGTTAGAGNVISGNESRGVGIAGSGATGNRVEGNYIGTDVTGTADLGNSGTGLDIAYAPSNTIGGTAAGAGNVISGNGWGVVIQGSAATGNTVQGNYIGTQADGTADLGNSGHGVFISGGISNTIGGAAAGAGNTIAFNGGDGVFVIFGTGNLIDPNSIHSNTRLGIDLGDDGVTPNDTGDGDTGANNLQNFPVLTSALAGGATTTIEGTLNSTANTDFTLEFFSNSACDPSGNGEGESFVGSTTETTDGGGNVSFSVSFGTAVPVGEFITATATDPNDNTSEFSECEEVPPVFTVDSTGDGGDSNPGNGICDDGGGICTLRAAIQEANVLAGTDTIEFDIPGAGPHTISPGSALPTISDAVIIDGTSEPDFSGSPIVELDGTNAGTDGLNINAGGSTVKGLVINRFGGDGIELSGSGGNTIEGNYIGTDVNGTADLGNTAAGVYIWGAPSNTIGGTAAGAGNVISGNDRSGVWIYGSAATGNVVEGNYIGTDVTGTADLGNTDAGVYIDRAPSNTIGGTAAGARNVISGNNYGVSIYGLFSGPMGNVVEGNYIGTDVTGTADLGNSRYGVTITYAPSNTIGGTAAGAGNIISGNDQHGVLIDGSGATGNRVEGNYIGTDVTGTADLGNTGHGVYIWWAPSNTIGGTAAGAGNTIAFNGGDGVYVESGTGNLIDPNSIHSNSGLGIDLGDDGVTPNDTGDGDSGANNLQNFPVLTSALAGGATTTIEGTLNSTANTDFTLEFFSNSACDPSGNGEGESFVGSTTETTDGGGNVSFSVSFGITVPVGQFITSTATDPINNTSEFSECIAVAYPPVGGIAELPDVSGSAGRNYAALAGLAAAAVIALTAGAWYARRRWLG